MKPEKTLFPQEWGVHLLEEAEPQPTWGAYPDGMHRLRFEDMHATQFEQFCLWLLRKENEVVGCSRIGGQGCKQDGIDLFGYDKFIPDNLIVYECKCWHELDSGELTNTVERFLNGEWSNDAKKFVLIIAQPNLGKASKAWHRAKQKFTSRGISSDCWTGEILTAKVQPYPGIVSKFFPAAATSQFCNEWMGQESFTERLNMSALNPRKEILELVDERLGKKIRDTAHESKEERRFTTDSSWSFNGPILSIHCILPSESFYFGSASLTIRQRNLEGLIVVLNPKWMLENMLGNAGEPLESACRPFYVGKGFLDREEHTIDLGNCRMSISAHCIAALVSTIDELSSAYFTALRKLDNKWGIDGFPYVRYGNIYIALGVISKALWNEILRFSRDHDYKKGHTEWHIFDSAPGCLKPFTRNKQPKYNNGYHGIFYAKPINGLSHENELVIMWQPPGHFAHSISNEGWWSCNQAYSWFRSLLPEVGKWWANCQLTGFDRLFRRNTESHKLRAHWAEVATMKDVRVQRLCENENYNHVGLCETLSILQGFYNGGGRCSRAYFTKAQVTALYKASSLLVEGGRGYPSYISNNLSLNQKVEDHKEIVRFIQEKVASGDIVVNTGVIECIMRAMLETLADDETWVAPTVRLTVNTALLPFMRFYDKQNFIDQHALYC